MNKADKFILWFNEVGIEDVPLVGGKNASLGEMYRNLSKKRVNIPNGFAITAHAYRYFLEEEGIKNELNKVLENINPKSMKILSDKGYESRQLILKADLRKYASIRNNFYNTMITNFTSVTILRDLINKLYDCSDISDETKQLIVKNNFKIGYKKSAKTIEII